MRFLLFVLTVFALFYLVDLGLLVWVHRAWWARRWVRRAAAGVAVLVGPALVLWALGHGSEHGAWVTVGATVTALLFVLVVALLLAFIVTAPVQLGVATVDALSRRRAEVIPFPGAVPGPEALAAGAPGPGRPDRRRFLQGALALVPAATTATGAAGVLRSTTPPLLPQIPLLYPGLPADLQGLRLLHLSDLHVGPYVGLDEVADLVRRAADLRPDLVVVTGDICDDLPIYGETLALLEQLRPTLGIYASLGNHEYFRGIEAVRACFERASIPLLVDAGHTVPVGRTRLRLAGADDPRFLGDPTAYARLRASVERSLDGADSDAFHVLLSHRSQAFDTAAPLGVHLTLAGHTHGFQLGAGGRSLFERRFPELYIWGHYGGGDRQLYTSAGVGHWFPFRLGCPPEAPLFTLQAS